MVSRSSILIAILLFWRLRFIFLMRCFAAARLPILKEILVHLIMAFGSFVLFVLQIDKLPIIQCMAVAVVMMLLLRGRQLYDKRNQRQTSAGRSDAGSGSDNCGLRMRCSIGCRLKLVAEGRPDDGAAAGTRDFFLEF